MNNRRLRAGVLWAALLGIVFAPAAQARYLNEDQTFEIKGKIESKFTFKTQDSRGWATVPSQDPRYWPNAPDLEAGDLIQQRNISYIEGNFHPKQTTQWDFKLHATGRFLWDTVYQIGPGKIQDVRDFNSDYKEQIDDISQDAQLWEGYADLSNGPFFIRVGRQKISWGETDVYPILDRIMPIDNTFGGIFEDLDDRKIPIWAVRSTYNLGEIGLFNNFGLEAFWEPAFFDQQFAPQTPWGSVYNIPQPSGPPQQLMPEDPGDSLKYSRWGARIQGVLADNFNFSLAYFQSYPVDPALKSNVNVSQVLSGDTRGLIVEKHWIPTRTAGGSFSFFEPHTEAIVRGELAYTFDEPYFIPSKNFRTLYAFLGGNLTPPESEIPEWDVLRFSLAFDRPFWFRPLNKRSQINWTVEVFNEYYVDYDSNEVLPVPVYPSGDFVELHEWEHTILTMLYTTYMSGRLEPNVLVAYNPRGAGFWQASVKYRWDPFIFKVQYNDVFGDKDITPGILYDWDQIAFSITYTF
jgi:hypothetical protein